MSRLGELLLHAGLITQGQLQRALEYQRTHGGRITTALIELGILSERELTEFIALHRELLAVMTQRQACCFLGMLQFELACAELDSFSLSASKFLSPRQRLHARPLYLVRL